MWSDTDKTPWHVWSTSVIAAVTLHAGIISWVVNLWQAERTVVVSPAPIEVIPIPLAEPTQPDVQGLPPVPQPRQPAASPQPEPPPLPSPDSPAEPPQPPAPSPPRQPAAPTSPEPQPSTSPNNSGQPAQPPDAQTQLHPQPSPLPDNRPSPAPSPTKPQPTPQGGLRLGLELDNLSQGRDLPETFPQAPPDWQRLAALALGASGCFTQNSPRSVTVRLTVEAEGRISNMTVWSDRTDPAATALVECLMISGEEFPPLIPATDAGRPIPTDLFLLTVTSRFVE